MQANTAPLLSIGDLCITFENGQGRALAVQHLCLDLPQGAITCLVGESGCGKSLTAKAILRLTPATAELSGRIILGGQDLLALPEAQLRRIRGRKVSMIFQEPMTALNPVLRVGDQAAEPLRIHLGMGRKEARERTEELFASVGIPAAHERFDEYPHELSGGMRQRVMIAMALTCQPDLLLADEPTTALDATIQGQILDLILRQSRERGMGVLLISHDLGMVAQVADFVGVMYAGHLVEHAPAAGLFANPLHPYTQGLMHSAPSLASLGAARLPAIAGSVPQPGNLPPGCPFAPRCKNALARCHEALPPKLDLAGHHIRCWLHAA